MCYAMMRLCVQAQVWVRRGLICVIVLRTGVAQAELVDDFAVESHSADVLSVLLALTLHRAMQQRITAIYAIMDRCSERIMMNNGQGDGVHLSMVVVAMAVAVWLLWKHDIWHAPPPAWIGRI